MQEHDLKAKDRLEAAFVSKDSEATLTMPIANSSKDNPIDIMIQPEKKVGRSQSPTPSVLAYFLGIVAFSVFNDLALSMKHHFW